MRKFWFLIGLVIIGIVMAVSESAFAEQKGFSTTAGASFGNWKSDACVESVPIMRRQHMDFLLHQRNETMRYGVRTGSYSLKGCIACHAKEDKKGNLIPVDSSGQFCQDCHQRVAVNIDCFQCHVAIPSGAE
jgi:hypothetical protein